ncbi:MAG: TetR/AcrR family transcriptional regulator [Solirubrobacterales bacterium]
MAEGERLTKRHEEIIARAAVLFDEGGYGNVNMASVADSVGIAKPTLYHYFGGKDAILFEIHEQFIDNLLRQYESRRGLGLSAAEELKGLMADTFELMSTHRGHLRVFFESRRELSEEAQATIRAKRDRYESIMVGTIERGVANGEFRQVDPRLTALAVFGMCNWGYQWYRPEGELGSQELADTFFELLFEGLRSREP